MTDSRSDARSRDARSRAIRQPTIGTMTGLPYYRRRECADPSWIGTWERILQERASGHPRFLGGRHRSTPCPLGPRPLGANPPKRGAYR